MRGIRGQPMDVPVGTKYGNFTVIEEVERKLLPSGQRPRQFKCRCFCGTEVVILLLHLSRERIKSCGCLKETKKGESDSLLCRRWKAMIERCHPNAIDHHLYHDKGIQVCSEWLDYFTFKAWALANGFKPELQIDRIDGNKGYYPDNCHYVTAKGNANNREVTTMVVYKGERIALQILADRLGIRNQVTINNVRRRINRGWSTERAFHTPTKIGNYRRGKGRD